MAIKGLREIQEKAAEASELANQNRMRYLYLRDGESTLLRFIDDEEMLQTKIHEYDETTPLGKKYRKAYCVDNLMGAPCKWCASGNATKNVYVFLAYVYHILHKVQNPELNNNADATKWTAVKQAGQTLYREDVGEIRILRVKWGHGQTIKNAIMQFISVYNTLCDRDYVFSRVGNDKSTSYNFVPLDPAKMSDAVVAAKQDVQHIDEIIIGNRGASADKNQEAPAFVKSDVQNSKKESEDLF